MISSPDTQASPPWSPGLRSPSPPLLAAGCPMTAVKEGNGERVRLKQKGQEGITRELFVWVWAKASFL